MSESDEDDAGASAGGANDTHFAHVMNPWGDAWGDSDTDNEDETTNVDTVRVDVGVSARDESVSPFCAALARFYRCSL